MMATYRTLNQVKADAETAGTELYKKFYGGINAVAAKIAFWTLVIAAVLQIIIWILPSPESRTRSSSASAAVEESVRAWCPTGFNCLKPGEPLDFTTSRSGSSPNAFGTAVCVPKGHVIAVTTRADDVRLAYKVSFMARVKGDRSHVPDGNAGYARVFENPLDPDRLDGEIIPSVYRGTEMLQVPQTWEAYMRRLPKNHTKRCAWVWVLPERAQQGEVTVRLRAQTESQVVFR
jgi:hypothetical protein